jgi:hypothetical protein
MMEQNREFGVENAQKGPLFQLQLHNNLSIYSLRLLDAKNHTNTPVYY